MAHAPGGFATPNSHGLGISKGSKNPDLAWDFLKFITERRRASSASSRKLVTGNVAVDTSVSRPWRRPTARRPVLQDPARAHRQDDRQLALRQRQPRSRKRSGPRCRTRCSAARTPRPRWPTPSARWPRELTRAGMSLPAGERSRVRSASGRSAGGVAAAWQRKRTRELALVCVLPAAVARRSSSSTGCCRWLELRAVVPVLVAAQARRSGSGSITTRRCWSTTTCSGSRAEEHADLHRRARRSASPLALGIALLVNPPSEGATSTAPSSSCPIR